MTNKLKDEINALIGKATKATGSGGEPSLTLVMELSDAIDTLSDASVHIKRLSALLTAVARQTTEVAVSVREVAKQQATPMLPFDQAARAAAAQPLPTVAPEVGFVAPPEVIPAGMIRCDNATQKYPYPSIPTSLVPIDSPMGQRQLARNAAGIPFGHGAPELPGSHLATPSTSTPTTSPVGFEAEVTPQPSFVAPPVPAADPWGIAPAAATTPPVPSPGPSALPQVTRVVTVQAPPTIPEPPVQQSPSAAQAPVSLQPAAPGPTFAPPPTPIAATAAPVAAPSAPAPGNAAIAPSPPGLAIIPKVISSEVYQCDAPGCGNSKLEFSLSMKTLGDRSESSSVPYYCPSCGNSGGAILLRVEIDDLAKLLSPNMNEKILIAHPESDSTFVGTRADLPGDGNLVEIGPAPTVLPPSTRIPAGPESVTVEPPVKRTRKKAAPADASAANSEKPPSNPKTPVRVTPDIEGIVNAVLGPDDTKEVAGTNSLAVLRESIDKWVDADLLREWESMTGKTFDPVKNTRDEMVNVIAHRCAGVPLS